MVRFAVFLLPLAVLAVDWPQWRGPNRNGISSETGLLKSWPAGGPKLIWKTSGLGEGYSAFSISQGKLFTQGQHGSQEYVIAIDTATGKKLWQTPAGKEYRERRGNGPRGTPTLDGDRLYALSADGTLVSLDQRSGKHHWTLNILDKFGGELIHWGISESPLVDGDRLIVTPGGRGASVVALNKLTGNLIWKSQNEVAGYSSPIAIDFGGSRQIAVFTSESAMGLNAATGERLWRYDKVSNRTANIATPIYHDGHVFVSSDYGTGAGLLKLSPAAPHASEVYFTREMKNHYSSSVLVGEYLYGFSSSVLTCMKFKTGEVAWRDRSTGKGSVAYADGSLYVFGENGTMALVEATPEAYREKSRFSIPAGEYPTWTPPVISDGRLYLREQDRLYSYDLKGSGR